MTPNPALDAVLALSRSPSLTMAMRAGALPTGVRLVLAILAGDDGAMELGRELSGLRDARLREAAEFYVLQIMLYRGSPSRRVLGVGPDADRAEARGHMRLLLMWLHPDRNDEAWQGAFAARVIDAWKAVAAGELSDDSAWGRPRAALNAAPLRWRVDPAEWPNPQRGRVLSGQARVAIATVAFLAGVLMPGDAAYSHVDPAGDGRAGGFSTGPAAPAWR